MSWDINRVIVVGRLANDIDLRYTPSGTAVAKFGIAVGGKPKPDGSDSVSFFNVTVWGKTAENCSNYIKKGKQVAVDGRLEQRTWTAQDGTKRSAVEIIADRIEFIGPSGQGGGGSEGGSGGQRQYNKKPAGNNEEYPVEEDNFYDNTGFDSNPVDPGFGNEPSF